MIPMTRTGAAARPAFEDRTESFLDSARVHWRKIGIAALGVVAIAGAAGLYTRSQGIKAERAAQALAEAQRSLGAGNAPLAQTDLQKMVSRYEGTPSAAYGSLLLAQLLYDQGKPAEGLKILTDLERSGPPKEMLHSVYALLAAGYEQQGKPAAAAARYMSASENAAFELTQANYKADAARAYTAAGNKEQARKLWTELSADPTAPLAQEARVRLGELTATPVSRS